MIEDLATQLAIERAECADIFETEHVWIMIDQQLEHEHRSRRRRCARGRC
jgi:hypothetical protein